VHVSPGSEPERDDNGLPPVDIEIPDDARELDRDVQAYYREQRAHRRNMRSRRFHGVLARDSMVVPLLICCLVFALISGTLLTLFTATSIDQGLPGQGSASGSLAAPVGTHDPILESDTVAAGGGQRTLSMIGPAVLLEVPANCSCRAATAQIVSLAAKAGVGRYLVYTGPDEARVDQLARELGHGIIPAEDVTGRLQGYAGLTAFLVTTEGSVTYFQQLQSTHHLDELLQAGNV
jgi:hypothetical protein